MPLEKPMNQANIETKQEEAGDELFEKEMTKKVRKQLESAFSDVLKIEDFKKEGSNWRRQLEDVIDLVYLQKSYYSRVYYINLGILIRELDRENLKPKIEECDFNARLEGLIIGEKRQEEIKNLRESLDFNNVKTDMDIEERIVKIKNLLRRYAIPFFESLDSIGALKDYTKEKKEKRSRWEFVNTNIKALEFLGKK